MQIVNREANRAFGILKSMGTNPGCLGLIRFLNYLIYRPFKRGALHLLPASARSSTRQQLQGLPLLGKEGLFRCMEAASRKHGLQATPTRLEFATEVAQLPTEKRGRQVPVWFCHFINRQLPPLQLVACSFFLEVQPNGKLPPNLHTTNPNQLEGSRTGSHFPFEVGNHRLDQ